MLPVSLKAGKVDRKVIRKSVKKLIRDIERKSGTPVPKITRDLIFDIAIKELFGKSVSTMPQFLSGKIREYNESMKVFDEMSRGLDENCKLMVDKLVRKLYEIKKEPFLTYWRHMPVINYCIRVSEDLENLGPHGIKRDTQIFLISYLYVAIYELMIELLFDAALEISEKSQDDEVSLNLKRAHQRKPYLRTALFGFLEKRNYLGSEGSESLTQLSNFRDKIAHLLVYYDNERDKLFLDGEYVNPLIIREMYERLLSLFSYLVIAFSKESGLLNGLKNFEEKLRMYVRPLRHGRLPPAAPST